MPVEETASAIKNSKGHVTDVVLIFRDISEQRRTETILRSLSLTDDLTGLNNRRGFLSSAEQTIELAFRGKMGVFMCFIDLDGLKQINDSLGHEKGDQAIISTAEILKANFRSHDILARWGGDELQSWRWMSLTLAARKALSRGWGVSSVSIQTKVQAIQSHLALGLYVVNRTDLFPQRTY
jgi:diguanylate cyclase (GGDEF)-like protein